MLFSTFKMPCQSANTKYMHMIYHPYRGNACAGLPSGSRGSRVSCNVLQKIKTEMYDYTQEEAEEKEREE